MFVILIRNKHFYNLSVYFNTNINKIAENYLINSNNYYLTNKVNSVKNALNDLSLIYNKLYLNSASVSDLIKFITEKVNKNYCKNCNINYCKNKENLKNNVSSLVNLALNKGKITLLDISSGQSLNCFNINQIINFINDSIEDFNNFNKNINNQNKNLVAISDNFEGFNLILDDFIKQNNINKISDKFKTSDLVSEFNYYNVFVKEIIITEDKFNNFNSAILVVKTSDAGKLIYAEILEKILGFKVSITENKPTKYIGLHIVLYKIKNKFRLFLGISQKSKLDKNGDNYFYEKIDNNSIIALSDGMGSGDLANKSSNYALDLLYSLEKAGLETKYALNIINKLIIPYNQDNFVTIDAVNINLLNGEINFIKFASSISLIKRKNQIDIIKPESLPIGIINNVSPTLITTAVEENEYIIMASDGVVDAFSEDSLIEFISNVRTTNAQMLADQILEEAQYRSKLDDLTCIVIKVNKNV
ncbi:MAG: SpoIIE family protein phosphatase [Clostridia bacterium]|nr:SpoIIE family protein phosphatase [Clostridia bacterium]